MPGVQYPHWSAPASRNASWSGCSLSPSATPSMVRTGLPSAAATLVTQDRTRRPSRITVQAPHCPSPQPYLAPVSAEVVAQDAQQAAVRVGVEVAALAVDLEAGHVRHGFQAPGGKGDTIGYGNAGPAAKR